ELLVVIIIIGILAAIALPSFLNQANKAKESEAKTYIGSMNRAQQAYILEKGVMANQANFGKLGLGIASVTTNYEYVIVNPSTSQVTNQARPVVDTVRAYIGGVKIGQQAGTGEATSLAILCEAENAPVISGPTGAQEVTYGGATAQPTCPTDYAGIGEN
ncbi:MAG: type IV pilin-like G/H family protein, partial [Cyanobacteria bacterium J06632_22]